MGMRPYEGIATNKVTHDVRAHLAGCTEHAQYS